MEPPRPAHRAQADVEADAPWRLLPSGSPLLRRGLCGLAQPCLKQPQRTPRFLFQDATVLSVVSGRLRLDDGNHRIDVDAPDSLLMVEANTCADLLKAPGGAAHCFRSVFLTLTPQMLDAFHRFRPPASREPQPAVPFRQMRLDDDLASALQHALASVGAQQVSDERLRYRLMDFLAALAERGHVFRQVASRAMSVRLRSLIGETPDRRWTAQEAGKALAVSEATLRRRLSAECLRFEDVLIDVRMHHAMLLLQTTSWSMPQIAHACGYRSRARFAERFRIRFGCLPSSVR